MMKPTLRKFMLSKQKIFCIFGWICFMMLPVGAIGQRNVEIGRVDNRHVFLNKADVLDLVLEQNQLTSADSLIIHGPLSGEDLRCLKLLAGGRYIAIYHGKEVNRTTTLRYLDLSNATLAPGNSGACTVDPVNMALGKWKKYLLKNNALPSQTFGSCESLECLVLPDSVEIVTDAFANCKHLQQVVLPFGLKEISASTFDGDIALQKVYCRASQPAAMYYASEAPLPCSIFRQAVLFVPLGAKKAYSKADGWKEFKEIVEYPTTNE